MYANSKSQSPMPLLRKSQFRKIYLALDRNGIKCTGKHNYLCKDYRKQFPFAHQNRGDNPRIRKQIKSSLIHGSGIRDCAAVFQVSQQSVLNLIIPQAVAVQIKPRKKHYERILMDEFYAFVQNKR